MDFVNDQLYDVRRFRVLAIVDNHTRESLALMPRSSTRGIDVMNVLELIASAKGYPKRIKVDNGPEFISKEVDLWAYTHQVTLDYSRRGQPTDNALIEAFNSRFRQECLNEHWFLTMDDAYSKIESWRSEYNSERPHSALGYRTPNEFIDHLGQEDTTAA